MRHDRDLLIILYVRLKPSRSTDQRIRAISCHHKSGSQWPLARLGVKYDSIVVECHGGTASRHAPLEADMLGKGRIQYTSHRPIGNDITERIDVVLARIESRKTGTTGIRDMNLTDRCRLDGHRRPHA